MYDAKKDPEFLCGTLAINDRPWEGPEPHPLMHREAFFEITGQLIEFLEKALQNKEDVWKPIRIMVQAEHLIDMYTRNHFDLLVPLQADLQVTIRAAFRMARRAFYRRALRAPPHEVALYQKDLDEGFLWDEEAEADFEAVQQHLRYGTKLMEGLGVGHGKLM
jgi:hypothetical protein